MNGASKISETKPEFMRDFVQTHKWKNVTTEDFRAIAEKHMDGKPLKWFFDEWVYGTEIPKYKFAWTTETNDRGGVVLVCKVEQTEVSSGFKMIIPILIDFGENHTAVARLAVDQASNTIRLDIPQKPKNVVFNYDQSVLAYE